MTWRYNIITTLLCSLLLLVACKEDTSEMAMREMPMTLRFPVAQSPTTKVPGDPGNPVEMPAPTHVYLYLWTNGADGEYVSYMPIEGIAEDDWTYSELDRMYYYNKDILLKFPARATEGRVYGVAARHDAATLQLSVQSSTTMTQAALEAATFHYDPTAASPISLRDLYASPSGNTDAETNGTVSGINTVRPKAALTLYHLAAKVDFTWNCNPEPVGTVPLQTLRAITINKCPKGTCNLFSFNSRSALDAHATANYYDLHLVAAGSTNKGNEYNGRADGYVLPVDDKMLHFQVDCNDITDAGNPTTESYPGLVTTSEVTDQLSDVFAAWYRPMLLIGWNGTTKPEW